MSAFGLSLRLFTKNIGQEFRISINSNNINKIGQSAVAAAATAATATFVPVHNQPIRNYSILLQNKNYALDTMRGTRDFSIQEITKNMQLFTQEPRKSETDPKTLRLNKPIDKPLVIILSWLLAKQKHLAKYAELYINQGCDVITVNITPWQLLWPTKGSQVVASELLRFLENNAENSTLFLHGFSVGGYVWGECMVHMARDTNRYNQITKRICGQIWDSAADVTEIPIGFPKAVFPRNPTLEKALRSYIIYHLKTFHDTATTHYIRSSQMFHSNLVKAPALFLLSKTDPVGAEASNQRVRDSWESIGIQCAWKCWDKSAHVSHYHKHRHEYIELVTNHMMSVNLIKYPERLRAKL